MLLLKRLFATRRIVKGNVSIVTDEQSGVQDVPSKDTDTLDGDAFLSVDWFQMRLLLYVELFTVKQ